MDLGGGKDSYMGLPVSHGEEEGNGGSVPWSWCRTRNQKWTRAKIESHGREKNSNRKKKKPPVLLCCRNLHVMYVLKCTVIMSRQLQRYQSNSIVQSVPDRSGRWELLIWLAKYVELF